MSNEQEPTFVNSPVCMIDTIAMGPNGSRILQPDEKPEPGDILYAGKRRWNNVLIRNLHAPLGEKLKSLTLANWTLHGVIPIHRNDNVTECVIDYAEMLIDKNDNQGDGKK